MATQIVATRYELLDRIGVGGAAVVYRARDTRLERIVALKVLREELADDPEFVERFYREARIAAGLSHPNLVGVHDFGEFGDTAFLAMDYVDGETLKQRLQREGRLPASEAADIASQVLAGLAAVHARGLVHRDVKPQNVLLTSDGIARLTDFGIAGGGGISGLTQAGTTVGTALYMSPEQARGDALGPSSDVYSAGALLYELLTGQPPFLGRTPVEVSYKHMNEPLVPPSTLAPDVSPELEAVVMRALAKEPSARFASADAMLRALDLGLDPLGSTSVQHTARHPRAAAIERDRAAESALAAAVGADEPLDTPAWGQAGRTPRGAYGAAARARWGAGYSAAEPTRPWLRRALAVGVVAGLAVGGVVFAAGGGLTRPRSSGQPVLAGAAASSAEAATTRPGTPSGATTPFTLNDAAVSPVGSVELAPVTGTAGAPTPLGSPSAGASRVTPASTASGAGSASAAAGAASPAPAQAQPAPNQQAPGTAQSAPSQPSATAAQPTPPPPASPVQPAQAPAPAAPSQPATAAPAPAPAAPPQPAQPTAAPPAATNTSGPTQPTPAPSAQPGAPPPTAAPAQPQPTATGAPAKPTAAVSPAPAQPTAASTAPTAAPRAGAAATATPVPSLRPLPG